MREERLRRVLQEIAQERVPGARDVWPGLRDEVVRRESARKRRVRAWAGLSTAIILVAAAALLWMAWPEPVSARGILKQAQVVAQAPAEAGIKSYMFKQQEWWTEPGRWLPEGEEPTQEELDTVITEKVVYFEAPDRVRIEALDVQVLRGRNTFGVGPDLSKSLTVSDGEQAWLYFPEDNFVFVAPAEEMEAHGPTHHAFNLALMPGLLQMAEYPQIIDELLECYEPELEEDGVVAGRTAWVIDLGEPEECLPPRLSGEPRAGVRVWIDQERYVVLKTVVYGAPHGTPRLVAEVTDIAFNVELDPGLFTFTPPPGATVRHALEE